MLVGEQVGLDGGAFLHGWRQRTKSGQSNFTNHRGAEVFRGALKEYAARGILDSPEFMKRHAIQRVTLSDIFLNQNTHPSEASFYEILRFQSQ
jgi:hypothetical protein